MEEVLDSKKVIDGRAIVFRENLLQDIVIFRYLLKHTARLCVCQVPLQLGGTFVRTNHLA
jgi:hypothetical protein